MTERPDARDRRPGGRHRQRRRLMSRLRNRRSCTVHDFKPPVAVGGGIVRTACRRCGDIIIDLREERPTDAKVLRRRSLWE